MTDTEPGGTPIARRRFRGVQVPGARQEAWQFGPIEGAFYRYKVLAYTVGVGLAVLVFIGMPLQYGAGDKQVVDIVGPFHGALYIVYLIAALDLVRRARFPLWQLALMIGAGFVPGLAFVVEHYAAKWVVRTLDQRDAAEHDEAVVDLAVPAAAGPDGADTHGRGDRGAASGSTGC